MCKRCLHKEKMKEYEYLVYKIIMSIAERQDEINKMAEDGWRLIAIGKEEDYYFERKLDPPNNLTK